ncbi:MAG: hypothetical protein Q8R86_08460 [Sulfuricurvum sp.]|nr:hypothetical protein [Sulfuricurvum sp.]
MQNFLRLSLISLAAALLLSACRADEYDANTTAPITSIGQAILAAEANGTIPKLNHDDTIVGPDTDNNGIRDDIDAYIATLPYTEVQKKAVQQDARALTATLIIDTNDSVALKTAGEKIMRAVNCIFDKFDLQIADQVTNDMEKMTINTKNRFMQYEKYNSARSGSVTSLPSGDTCEQ